MNWSDAQQNLARAVYAATKIASRDAPMNHVVSTGNVLMRTFKRQYLTQILHNDRVNAFDLNSAALTVRDADQTWNRFSGIIPSHRGLSAIASERGGALYCAKDVRAQMAEMLHYTTDSARRAPGSLPVALGALQGLCMVLIKPVNDLSLVTLDGDGPESGHFFDQLQRVPAVRAALQACRYTDITQAIYSPADYSASRGFGLGLVSNPGIDGIEIGSARSFETVSSDSSMSVFKSGTNVLLFGRANEVLSHRLRIVQVTLLDINPTGGWLVVTMQPNALGQFDVVSKTALL